MDEVQNMSSQKKVIDLVEENRKLEKEDDVEDETTTTDEEMGDEEEALEAARFEALQASVGLEVREWLAEHGAKLFALEISKARVRYEKAEVKQSVKLPEKRKREVPLEQARKDSTPKRQRIGSRVR